MSNVVYNGVDLSLIAELHTPRVRGPHDLVGVRLDTLEIPGRLYPEFTVVRRDPRPIQFHCVVRGDDHADLISKLELLKEYLSPDLEFCPLVITDRPNKRLMVWFDRGVPVDIDEIPYIQDILEFDLQGLRFPFWEDSDAQVTSFSGVTSGTLQCGGSVPCYPVYTCTLTGNEAGGIWFSVNNEVWSYDGALITADVLTVNTFLPDVRLNGVRDFANTSDEAVFPQLAKGSNAIALSSTNFDLDVSYRRLYE
jgi:phage-related protein